MDSTLLNLLDLLAPEAVALNFPATSAEAVIRHLAAALFKGGYVRETFAEAALEREARLPTGLRLSGEIHAAIPHTDIEHVIRPAVGLATLPTPVVFQNMIDPTDAVPVRLVFLLALEQPKSQVEMLQQVATILQNPQVVSELVAAQTLEEVRRVLAQVVPTQS
ncbi:PTS sugar transporter subunit IIA [uncultured Thermanaerothrix sp.]|uniref:PTS sugar transporter subunit IIA n=1 Tax=uncultured Thermanaerothrix sp. TaxID=1195149 RepID=UPI00260D7B92|nr:PTS sugar transporter subunit IIA [uncultured Thermanaerothrix sp.]